MMTESLDENQQTVRLTTEPVALYKILKFENLATSGGEAKHWVADGKVKVNGQVETRKRRKIYAGDEVAFNGVTLVMTK